MKVAVKKRHIFNIFGVIIIALWISLMSLHLKKHYVSPEPVTGIENPNESGKIRKTWKEIYLKDKKVGYSINVISPVQNGYYIQDELFLKLNLMGFEKGLYTITQASVDTNFRLKNFFFRMNSGVIKYRIDRKVEGNILKIKTGTGRRAKRTELKLSEIPMMSSGVDEFFRNVKLVPGESHRLSFFDPSTMTQKAAVFNVKALEKIKIKHLTYEAYRIEGEMYGNKLTFWVDKSGDILREEGFMGLTMVKSSAANAPSNLEEGADDFYEIAAVKADKKLPNPDKLSLLKLKLKGTEDIDFDWSGLTGERQDFSNNIITVELEKKHLKHEYTIPYSGDDAEIKKYLLPEINIESDDKKIIELAHKIAGKAKNPAAVSAKMMGWVHSSLSKQPVVSIPSAVEVLETRTGDCNEHATLLTALLRAAGIPARISVGLVYMREAFFYHAWVEAYTGEWITLDPTLNQIPADVTHISFLRGNIDKQVEIMALIGKIEIEVVDFEYN